MHTHALIRERQSNIKLTYRREGNMQMETELGVMQPWARECLSLPEKARKNLPVEIFEGL